jgi:hypothetical protein
MVMLVMVRPAKEEAKAGRDAVNSSAKKTALMKLGTFMRFFSTSKNECKGKKRQAISERDDHGHGLFPHFL